MSEEIKHYGVKGMKWGVIRKAGSAVIAADQKRVDTAKKVNAKVVDGVKRGAHGVKNAVGKITPEQRKSIATGVATGAATAVATAIAVGSSIAARNSSVPTSQMNKYAADKMDQYMRNHYFDDQIQFELLNNYSSQVRRGDR